jgi:ribosomal-protein-alanine N-acetyltransferase
MSTMALAITRLTRASEVDAVLEIEQASFTNPWTRQMYLTELERPDVSYCYLARTAGAEVVGFCSLWLVLDEIHINNIAVAPAYRRTGVATTLLAHAIGEGVRLGAVRARLEVRRSNEAARLLYERFGFTMAGVRRAYYSKPVEDAIVLSCERLGPSPAAGREPPAASH